LEHRLHSKHGLAFYLFDGVAESQCHTKAYSNSVHSLRSPLTNREISAAAQMLNSYAGVPHGMLKGFRAPFLNYTADTLKEIQAQGFLYDTSATAVVDDCYW
jgi:hypothetical protein